MALVRVGVALGPHGVRGELKLSYTTDRRESLSAGRFYLLWDSQTNEAVQLTCDSVRELADACLLHFQEFDAPEPLSRFKGWSLLHCAARGELPRAEGEVYLFELQGLEVRDASGTAFAHVADVVDSGAHVLLELDLPGRPYVPYVGQHIPVVNLEQGYLICTYPLTPARGPRESRKPQHPRQQRRRKAEKPQ